MYADQHHPAMKYAMDETARRDAAGAYNEEHGIVPQTVVRAVMTGTIVPDRRS
jgi:excinuclease ABC subunit B